MPKQSGVGESVQPTCNVSETSFGVIGFLWLMIYRPLAEGVVAARICALATSLTSAMTGVPAITSLSKHAYCKAHLELSGTATCSMTTQFGLGVRSTSNRTWKQVKLLGSLLIAKDFARQAGANKLHWCLATNGSV